MVPFVKGIKSTRPVAERSKKDGYTEQGRAQVRDGLDLEKGVPGT